MKGYIVIYDKKIAVFSNSNDFSLFMKGKGKDKKGKKFTSSEDMKKWIKSKGISINTNCFGLKINGVLSIFSNWNDLSRFYKERTGSSLVKQKESAPIGQIFSSDNWNENILPINCISNNNNSKSKNNKNKYYAIMYKGEKTLKCCSSKEISAYTHGKKNLMIKKFDTSKAAEKWLSAISMESQIKLLAIKSQKINGVFAFTEKSKMTACMKKAGNVSHRKFNYTEKDAALNWAKVKDVQDISYLSSILMCTDDVPINEEKERILEYTSKNSGTAIIFTDGSCGNKQSCSAFAAFYDGKFISKKQKKYIQNPTSFEAEGDAIISALSELPLLDNCKRAFIVSDSESHINIALGKNIKGATSKHFLNDIKRAVKNDDILINYIYVKGHSTCPMNIYVDQLVSYKN